MCSAKEYYNPFGESNEKTRFGRTTVSKDSRNRWDKGPKAIDVMENCTTLAIFYIHGTS